MKPEDLLPQPPWKGPPVPKFVARRLTEYSVLPLIEFTPSLETDVDLQRGLRVYERVAREQPVSDMELREANLGLARVLKEGIDYAKEDLTGEELRVPRERMRNLEKATSRVDMAIALDNFWNEFHDNPENVLANFLVPPSTEEASLMRKRLDELESG